MKQQITARVYKITIDGRTPALLEPADITLEFSAIDTGGSFCDPILDFAYELKVVDGRITKDAVYQIVLELRAPEDKELSLSFAYEGKITQVDGETLAGMGRLQNGEVTPDMVKFIIRCLR